MRGAPFDKHEFVLVVLGTTRASRYARGVIRFFALALGTSALVIACGSSDDEGASTSASQVTASNDKGDAAPAPSNACVPCTEQHPDGAKTYEASRRACFCTETTCQSGCAKTLCARPATTADDTCNACLDDHYSECLQVVQAACESNADCKKYVLCKVDSACK